MMTKTDRLLGALAIAALTAFCAVRGINAQTLLTTTTLSAAVTSTSATTVTVASTTGITANTTSLWVDVEVMAVLGVNTNGNIITVRRGANGTAADLHATSSTVTIIPNGTVATVSRDPVGPCTRGSGGALYLPVINTSNGNVWVCRLVSGAYKWVGTNIRPLTYNSFPSAFTQ